MPTGIEETLATAFGASVMSKGAEIAMAALAGCLLGGRHIGGNKIDYDLRLYGGKPQINLQKRSNIIRRDQSDVTLRSSVQPKFKTLDEFLPEPFSSNGFSWTLWVKPSGRWKRKALTTGLVFYVTANLEGPFCCGCKRPSQFTKREGFWDNYWVCQSCKHECSFIPPDRLASCLMNAIDNKIVQLLQ
jgi:hypothetical protein